uniref:Activator of basal transcription 1 n=1 Tax=Anopheles atroparvus TaxID=41427 RepID=A0AAG5DUP0_ANOAO
MKKGAKQRASSSEESPVEKQSEIEEDGIAEQSENEEDGSDKQSDSEDVGEEQSENEEDNGEKQSENDEDQMETDSAAPSKKRPKVSPLVKKKKNKAGIVYISSIPKHMNVAILRGLLEPYGEIGRIFLEPERKGRKIRKKTANGKLAMIKYVEGWVEFVDKRVAKAIAPMLNTKPISTNRKSVFCDILWTMKYLPRFKWINLSERLAYERAVTREKLRAEIQQTRAEASVFEAAMSSSAALKARERTKTKTRKQDSE